MFWRLDAVALLTTETAGMRTPVAQTAGEKRQEPGCRAQYKLSVFSPRLLLTCQMTLEPAYSKAISLESNM